MMLAHLIQLLWNYRKSLSQSHTSVSGIQTYSSSAVLSLLSFPIFGIAWKLHSSSAFHRWLQVNWPDTFQGKDYPLRFFPGTGLIPDVPSRFHFQGHPSVRKSLLPFHPDIYFLHLSGMYQKDISSLLTYRHHFLP